LVLQNLGNTPFFVEAYSQTTPAPPDPCNAFLNSSPGLLQAIDGSIVMFYEPVVRRHATATVTVAYKGR
jgi:hypothetical protein